jgi:sulfur relay (sulfurtransferase) DsrC/TusE family protein
MSYKQVNTQKQLLLDNLMEFYKNNENLKKMTNVINGESKISLRIIDWFVTNYAKKYYTVYESLPPTLIILTFLPSSVYSRP